MTIKFGPRHVTVNGCRRGVSYGLGPYVSLPAGTITIYAGRSGFPAGIRAHFAIENNSDSMTDYFEADKIRVLPSHPLHDTVLVALLSA